MVIDITSVLDQRKVPSCISREDQPAAISSSTLSSDQDQTICDVNFKPLGRWFGVQRRTKTP